MAPELKLSKDGESLGNAVKDVVWSRDTTEGRDNKCSLDSKETAPFLVLLYSMVVWPHKADGKRRGRSRGKAAGLEGMSGDNWKGS